MSLAKDNARRSAEALRSLLTGNLYTDEDGGCEAAKALQRVAAAQLRAVRAAMCGWTSDGCMMAPHTTKPGERPGWEPADTFTKNDAIEALGGTIALLHFGPDLLDEAESVLAEPEAAAERDLAVLRQVAETRGAS